MGQTGSTERGTEPLKEEGTCENVGVSDLGQSLELLENYLKGATYGPGGADGFTVGTPAALFGFDNSYYTANYYDGIAHANT